MSITTVTPVRPVTNSSIRVHSVSTVALSGSIPEEPSSLHRVDNGTVFMVNGAVTDISFGAVPPSMMPRGGERSFDWYTRIHADGLVASASGSEGATYLKTIIDDQMEYVPTCECILPGFETWLLYSDIDREVFRRFDSVALYDQMAFSSFAFGVYGVDYLDSAGSFESVYGHVLMVPLAASEIQPEVFSGTESFSIIKNIEEKESIETVSPAMWIHL